MTRGLCDVFQLVIFVLTFITVTSSYAYGYHDVCLADNYSDLVWDKAFENLHGGYYNSETPIDSEFYYDDYYYDEYWDDEEEAGNYVSAAEMMQGFTRIAESISKLGEQLSGITKSMGKFPKSLKSATPQLQ